MSHDGHDVTIVWYYTVWEPSLDKRLFSKFVTIYWYLSGLNDEQSNWTWIQIWLAKHIQRMPKKFQNRIRREHANFFFSISLKMSIEKLYGLTRQYIPNHHIQYTAMIHNKTQTISTIRCDEAAKIKTYRWRLEFWNFLPNFTWMT